jgi:hypothetical protein
MCLFCLQKIEAEQPYRIALASFAKSLQIRKQRNRGSAREHSHQYWGDGALAFGWNNLKRCQYSSACIVALEIPSDRERLYSSSDFCNALKVGVTRDEGQANLFWVHVAQHM